MRSLLLVVLATGCLPEEHDPGDYSLSLTVDTSAAGTIDRLAVFGGDTPISVGGELPTAPVTPAMLAAGQPPPAAARLVGGGSVGFAMPAWAQDHTGATMISTDVDYGVLGTYGLVVGYHLGVPVAAGELRPGEVVPSDVADSVARVALAPATVEVWGHGCVRFVTPSETHYVVTVGDYDCDGQFGAADCKPTTYCDPSATSGPAHDACVCP